MRFWPRIEILILPMLFHPGCHIWPVHWLVVLEFMDMAAE